MAKRKLSPEEAAVDEPSAPREGDAVLSITIDMARGSQTQIFNISGLQGRILACDRRPDVVLNLIQKSLDGIFGRGNVSTEE